MSADSVDAYPETVPVPAFGPRMVCTGCGMIGADARPHWSERRDPGQINARSLGPAISDLGPDARLPKGEVYRALEFARRDDPRLPRPEKAR